MHHRQNTMQQQQQQQVPTQQEQQSFIQMTNDNLEMSDGGLNLISNVEYISQDAIEIILLILFGSATLLSVSLSPVLPILFILILCIIVVSIVVYLFNPFRSDNIYIFISLWIFWIVISFGYSAVKLHTTKFFVLEFLISCAYGVFIILSWNTVYFTGLKLKLIIVTILFLNILPFEMSNAFSSMKQSAFRVIMLIISFILISTKYRLKSSNGIYTLMRLYINLHYIVFGWIWLSFLLFTVIVIKEGYELSNEYSSGRIDNKTEYIRDGYQTITNNPNITNQQRGMYEMQNEYYDSSGHNYEHDHVFQYQNFNQMNNNVNNVPQNQQYIQQQQQPPPHQPNQQ